MGPNDNRFTIYDVLEKRGAFRHNPANAGATDKITKEVIYKGPVEYPKMFYHPEGKTTEYLLGDRYENTPFGPIKTNTHQRLISAIANDKAEEDKLVAAGWHDRPWKAMKAGGMDMSRVEAAQVAAPMTQDAKDAYIKQLEATLASRGITINGNEVKDVNALMAATRPTEELLADAEAAANAKRAADLQSKGLIEDED